LTEVKLVSYSRATEEFENEGLTDLQELIAFCAKVSNPAAQINTETSERLIKYLIKHQHWSPLEMVNAVLEINTTRDIAHQIVRHRSFAFQEFSQRYADPAEFGNQFVLREARLQDTKNRQNSIELGTTQQDMNLINDWESQQEKVIAAAKEAYEWAIDNGIAKEQARVVLPEGLTKTRLYMNGTIRSWVHYIQLRGANGTQKEHMDIAVACAKVISEIFPIAKNLT
jgi:thymidylate synthase (FAD)